MRLLWGDKDGGPESLVWCWGIESKVFGSVLLLKFGEGSREAFHTHAFNSLSWVISGWLHEVHNTGPDRWYLPSFRPIVTRRDTFHMVEGMAPVSWVFTLRGPWVDRWREFLPRLGKYITLTHGRREIEK